MLNQGSTITAIESPNGETAAAQPNSEDKTAWAICIGTFDNSGIPITIAPEWSDYVAVAFQVISLQMLLLYSLELGSCSATYTRHQDGTVIRIERNLKGFICYLEATEAREL